MTQNIYIFKDRFPEIKNQQIWKNYWDFIEHHLDDEFSDEDYTEIHHICPKCYLNKEDFKNQDNLIRLRGKDHFIAHKLLWLTVGGKMTHAFHRMVESNQNGKTEWLGAEEYEKVKIEKSELSSKLFKGKPLSEEHRKKISASNKGKGCSRFKGKDNPFYGKHHSEETKIKILNSKKLNYSKEKHPYFGKRGAGTPMYGKHHSEETKNIMREKALGRVMSEESREKMRISQLGNTNKKGKKVSEEGRHNISLSKKGVYSGKNNPMYGVHLNGELNGCFGKKCVSNGKINKYIKKEEVEEFLLNNPEWKLGCVRNAK